MKDVLILGPVEPEGRGTVEYSAAGDRVWLSAVGAMLRSIM